jgi:hypothetical protein
VEAAKARERKVFASPKREDFEREFGKDKVKDEGGGQWSLTLHERDDIKKAHQMQAGLRREEIERGEAVRAKDDGRREKVVRRDGRVVEVPYETVEQAKGRLRPAGRYGGAPSLRFGLSDAMGKYEQGPQGLWFVWNDGWEPTRMWEHQAKGDEQRDPDGNLWLKREGEWVLDSEEA